MRGDVPFHPFLIITQTEEAVRHLVDLQVFGRFFIRLDD